ncbi:hypothetical protein ERO13_D13G181866v2 [Gossypium hirsutum]|nr:hypothetical protein ERO13_D13G181866v2 [Gossypium hirsutum]
MGETTIFTERFEFEGMLRAMEKYKVTYMPVSPPLVLALTKSDLTNKYDISSLLMLGSGGAPLGKEVAERFKEKFPTVELCSSLWADRDRRRSCQGDRARGDSSVRDSRSPF